MGKVLMTISKIVSALSSSEIVLELKVLKAIVEPPVQVLKARATLKDGYLLEISESVGPDFRRYSYHLQKEDAMIKRWDNSPHWKNLKTFPYHIHKGNEAEPRESPEVFIEDVLREVKKLLSSNP
ncbi:MAG: DUF6516 family protein [Methanosarcina flavescens]|uniref:Uncharacterized protein n=4 Tax=Methanosarcina TaxID=2207 RepID=A0A0E3NB93_METTE|nr:DUF6516 family protein [Methanosarcina flavescens]AKB12152.1 hypothetical protein MSTHT_0394 [Methanosarcina thermophila TM-1]AKB14645.1 hypothetical protein MSTHC_0327 [Methanosarcina thermophila CHTI-55]